MRHRLGVRRRRSVDRGRELQVQRAALVELGAARLTLLVDERASICVRCWSVSSTRRKTGGSPPPAPGGGPCGPRGPIGPPPGPCADAVTASPIRTPSTTHTAPVHQVTYPHQSPPSVARRLSKTRARLRTLREPWVRRRRALGFNPVDRRTCVLFPRRGSTSISEAEGFGVRQALARVRRRRERNRQRGGGGGPPSGGGGPPRGGPPSRGGRPSRGPGRRARNFTCCSGVSSRSMSASSSLRSFP